MAAAALRTARKEKQCTIRLKLNKDNQRLHFYKVNFMRVSLKFFLVEFPLLRQYTVYTS